MSEGVRDCKKFGKHCPTKSFQLTDSHLFMVAFCHVTPFFILIVTMLSNAFFKLLFKASTISFIEECALYRSNTFASSELFCSAHRSFLILKCEIFTSPIKTLAYIFTFIYFFHLFCNQTNLNQNTFHFEQMELNIVLLSRSCPLCFQQCCLH